MSGTAILVTTYNRPLFLDRSLPQIRALGAPVLVVNDGGPELDVPGELRLPQNRGLAAAMNIGLAYWLADSSVEWISYFQDDVDVHPATLKVLARLHSHGPLLTGHDPVEHKAYLEAVREGVHVKFKTSSAGVHIHAHRDYWLSVMPIPTYRLGAPKRIEGQVRGMGSNVDWWITRDAPHSCAKTKRPIICVPGLVRTFVWEAKDSSWGAGRKAEEPPLTDLWKN